MTTSRTACCRKFLISAAALLPLFVFACGGGSSGGSADAVGDDARVDQSKAGDAGDAQVDVRMDDANPDGPTSADVKADDAKADATSGDATADAAADVAKGDVVSPTDTAAPDGGVEAGDVAPADVGPGSDGSSGTALGAMAESLGAGEWGTLKATDATKTLGDLGGASGMMTAYTDDLVWDSTGLEAFLIGADHLAPEGPQYASYGAASNSWRRLTRPAWLSSLVFFHGYDHTALDPVDRNIYHRPFGQNRVYRADLATQTWAPLPEPSLVNTYGNCCDALEFFPELGGLVWVRGVGEVWLFDEALKDWRQLGTWTEDGNTWTFAEYNPVHHVMIFGSGNSGNLYKLSSTGVVSPLKDPPLSIYDGSGYVGVLTVDPVGGDYLLLTPTKRDLRAYDVTTDTWRTPASTGKPDLGDQGVVATPISNYGVVMFAACRRSDCRTYVYKHM